MKSIINFSKTTGLVGSILVSLSSLSQFTNLNGLPIAYWDFESNANRSVVETTVDQAINSGFTYVGKFGGANTSSCGSPGRGVGYGGTSAGTALSAGGWATTSTAPGATYFEFAFNTTGFSGISYNWDNYANGSLSSWPQSALSYSTDGGATWAAYSTGTGYSARNQWRGWIITLPASCDNNPNVRIRIAGFWSTNVNTCTGSGSLSIDNLMVMATAIVPNAGVKNSLNETMIYTGTTSGLTANQWLRYNTFTINTGATLNLSGSNIYVGGASTPGAINVLSGGTLDCGSVTSRIVASTTGAQGSVTINSGATIVVRSPDGISTAGTATGNIQTTNRIYNSGGNYIYQNSSSSSYSQVTGSGLPTALSGNLTINNPSSVNLSTTTVVNNPGILYLTSGNLVLSSNNMTAQNITGGSATSYVKTNSTGVLIRPEFGAYTLFPVGNSAYNPAGITNSGTADSYNVRVVDNVTADGTGVGSTITNPVVNRTWMISEGLSGGSNVNLKLFWNGAGEQINNFNLANSPYMAHYSTTWDNWGGVVTASVAEKSGITTFSPFTVMSNTALPVEMVYLAAECAGSDVMVKWTTASEHNSMLFSVEHSEDGMSWDEIGALDAAGNSVEMIDYVYVHKSANRVSNYYRIVQVDQDGVSKIYGPVSTNCSEVSNVVTSYPNPSSNEFTIAFNGNQFDGESALRIIDQSGRIVYQKIFNFEKEISSVFLHDVNLTPGVYQVVLVDQNGNSATFKQSIR